MWYIIISIILFIFSILSFCMPIIKKYFPKANREVNDEKIIFSMQIGNIERRYYSLGMGACFSIAAFFFALSNIDMALNGIFFALIGIVVFVYERSAAQRNINFYEDKIVVRKSMKVIAEYPLKQICKVVVDHRHKITFDEDSTDYLPHINLYRLNERGKQRKFLELSLLSTNSQQALDFIKKLDVPCEEIFT